MATPQDRPLLTYVLAAVPKWVVAGVALWVLQALTVAPAWIAAALWGFTVGLDLAMFPVRRRYYESDPAERRMVGTLGVAVTDVAPLGYARVRGELWQARASRPGGLARGTRIRVVDIDGFTLVVEPDPRS